MPENCPYKNRFWAPEIHKISGRFYLIFTADNWLRKEFNPAGTWGSAGYAFVGVADRITGPYRHISWLRGAGCDTTLFGDADGRTYAFIPRGNIDVQEVDLKAMTLIGKPRRIVTADNADIGGAVEFVLGGSSPAGPEATTSDQTKRDRAWASKTRKR